MNFNLDQINWEPIAYFFFHSSLIMAVSAVVFFTLGLWFGYLTWARHKRRARAFQEECDLLRHEIASLKRRIVEETSGPAPNVAISADFSPPTVAPRPSPVAAGLGGVLGLPVEAEVKAEDTNKSGKETDKAPRPQGPSPLAQLVKNATVPEPPKVTLQSAIPTPAVSPQPLAFVTTPPPAASPPVKPASPPAAEPPPPAPKPQPSPVAKPLGAPVIVSKLAPPSEPPASKEIPAPVSLPTAPVQKKATISEVSAAPVVPLSESLAAAPPPTPTASLPTTNQAEPPAVPGPVTPPPVVKADVLPAPSSVPSTSVAVSKPELPAVALPAVPSQESPEVQSEASAITTPPLSPAAALAALPVLVTAAITPPPVPVKPVTELEAPTLKVEPNELPKAKTAPQPIPPQTPEEPKHEPKPVAEASAAAPTLPVEPAPVAPVAPPSLDPMARLASAIAAKKPALGLFSTPPATPSSSPSTAPTSPPVTVAKTTNEPQVADKLARLLGQAINPVAAAITPTSAIAPPPLPQREPVSTTEKVVPAPVAPPVPVVAITPAAPPIPEVAVTSEAAAVAAAVVTPPTPPLSPPTAPPALLAQEQPTAKVEALAAPSEAVPSTQEPSPVPAKPSRSTKPQPLKGHTGKVAAPKPLAKEVPINGEGNIVQAAAATAAPGAALAYASELASGEATNDPALGIVFHHRPDRWDDLTLLRGVAEILQHRLYEHGVFTFKQIALWSEDNIREFSTLFGFKERIQREKWCQQAKDLHFLKYGEKIQSPT